MATKLHVSNLPSSVTRASLRGLFEADGRSVDRLAIAMDRDTGEQRDIALVQMSTPEDAQAAIEALNGVTLDGNALAVRVARLRPAGRGTGH